MSMSSLENPEENENMKNEEAIVQGLLNGRKFWSGYMVNDYWFYLKNNDQILGMFCAHRFHPFKRIERVCVWLAYVLSAFGITLLLVKKDGQQSTEFEPLAIGFIASTFLSFLRFIETEAATCTCFQDGSMFSCFEESAEKCGRFVLVTSTTLNVLIFAAGMVRAAMVQHLPWLIVLRAFWISQLISFCLAQVTNVLTFLIGYYGLPCGCGCCCHAESSKGRHTGSRYPHGIAYPKDEVMMWGPENDHCGCCCPRMPLPLGRGPPFRSD